MEGKRKHSDNESDRNNGPAKKGLLALECERLARETPEEKARNALVLKEVEEKRKHIHETDLNDPLRDTPLGRQLACMRAYKSESKAPSNEKSTNQDLNLFGKFQIKRVLAENSLLKTICVEGNFREDDRTAIILLEKTAFQKEKLSELLTEKTDLTQKFENNIYSTYDASVPPDLNYIKVSVIHPATEKHIEKYVAAPSYLVQETPDTYKNVTLPYLLSLQFSLEWVYNILKHEKEADRIIFEDRDPEIGFTLLPDMKWNQLQKEDLHILALCHKRGIKSLRDLTAEHLPLLRNIKAKGLEILKTKYKISSHELRVYFHYQPSYYHLHVHFTALAFDGPGSRIETGHLLDTVINNLELFPDYYQKATLNFKVKENNPFYNILKESNVINDY